MPAPDVIVVGGGLAGLSAAVGLARRDIRVLVLEARGRLGGRASAFRDPTTGELVDNGQHVLLGCYHATFRYLRATGADTAVRMQASLEVPTIESDRRLGLQFHGVSVNSWTTQSFESDSGRAVRAGSASHGRVVRGVLGSSGAVGDLRPRRGLSRIVGPEKLPESTRIPARSDHASFVLPRG